MLNLWRTDDLDRLAMSSSFLDEPLNIATHHSETLKHSSDCRRGKVVLPGYGICTNSLLSKICQRVICREDYVQFILGRHDLASHR